MTSPDPTAWWSLAVAIAALIVSVITAVVSYRLSSRSTKAAERAADEAANANAIALGPAVVWRTRLLNGHMYALINDGREPATNVTIHKDEDVVYRYLPNHPITIEPGDAVEFLAQGTGGTGPVHAVKVECTELGTRRVPL